MPTARTPTRRRRRAFACSPVLAIVVLASCGGSPLPAMAAGDAGWRWPLAPPVTVQRDFVAPADAFSAGHRGIDLVASAGTPVHATADGVVSFSGVVVDRPVISIAHGAGLVTSYEPVAASVVAGDIVRRGELIGVVADGGHCAQRCLHVGLRVDGGYVSLRTLIGGIPRSVLLPLD